MLARDADKIEFMIRKACTGCGCDQCSCPDCGSKR